MGSTILTAWEFCSPWETSLGHVPHAWSSHSNQCCITKKQVKRQLCDNTGTVSLLDSQLLSENLPVLGPRWQSESLSGFVYMQATGGPHTCQSQHHGAGEGSQRVGGASQEQSQQSGHLSGSGRSQGSHQTSEGMWIWLFVVHCPLVCTSVYLLWWLALRFLISSCQEQGFLFSQGWGFVSVSASVLCRSLARFFVSRQSSLSVGGKIISQSVARFFVNDRFLCPSSLSFIGEVPCHWQCCHLSISGKILCPSVVRLFDNDQVFSWWQGSVNDKVLCRQNGKILCQ